jgi:hypothetical protein
MRDAAIGELRSVILCALVRWRNAPIPGNLCGCETVS